MNLHIVHNYFYKKTEASSKHADLSNMLKMVSRNVFSTPTSPTSSTLGTQVPVSVAFHKETHNMSTVSPSLTPNDDQLCKERPDEKIEQLKVFRYNLRVNTVSEKRA